MQAYLQQLKDKVQDLTLSLQQMESQLSNRIEQHRQAEIAFQKIKEELQILTTIDSLTQIPNRRCFEQYIDREWTRLAREKGYLSLLLCNIDNFKDYNRTYGREVGDDCLKTIAKTIDNIAKRPADIVTRYENDEFAVILPNTNLFGAVKITEKLMSETIALDIPHSSSKTSEIVTISVGIASQVPLKEQSIDDFIDKAKRALAQAKVDGKNQFVVHT